MSAIDYSKVKTIKIAPSIEDYTIGDNCVSVCFDNVPFRYYAQGLFELYEPSYVCECLSCAIAMHGKKWVMERVLNDFLKIQGTLE